MSFCIKSRKMSDYSSGGGGGGSLKLSRHNSSCNNKAQLLPSLTRNKILILEKYKKEICEKVKFSDISHHLLLSEYFTKDDCFEICSIPVHQQMSVCFEKVVNLLKNENRSQESDATVSVSSFRRTQSLSHSPSSRNRPEVWTILLRSLNVVHSGLTCKLDIALHKLSKKDQPRKICKEDIGAPTDFVHVQHVGRNGESKPSASPFRRFFSLRSKDPSADSKDPLFGMAEEDKELVKGFFKKAGVTEAHLRKPGSRKLILEFIAKNGGLEAIKQEMIKERDSNLLELENSSPHDHEDEDPNKDKEEDKFKIELQMKLADRNKRMSHDNDDINDNNNCSEA